MVCDNDSICPEASKTTQNRVIIQSPTNDETLLGSTYRRLLTEGVIEIGPDGHARDTAPTVVRDLNRIFDRGRQR